MIAKIRVDLSTFLNNIKIVRERIGKEVKVLFPVKSNAYGHGIVEMSKAAEKVGIDYLGVANAQEAEVLRKAGINLPILILFPSSTQDIDRLIELDVSLTVVDLRFARSLNRRARSHNRFIPIHVNVDTGIGRSGIFREDALSFFEELRKLPHLKVEGIFSHFSVASSEDSEDRKYTLAQIDEFNDILDKLNELGMLPPLCHIANSAGLIQYLDLVTKGYFNMVRPGTLLYGYPEVKKEWTKDIKPIMSLLTTVVQIKRFPPNKFISYGRTYKTKRPTKVAFLPIGYGSGFMRRLSNCGKVIVKNRKAPIIGHICMEQTMIDITDIPGVEVGDEVEVLGPRMPADRIARSINADLTEILTSFSGRFEYEYLHWHDMI